MTLGCSTNNDDNKGVSVIPYLGVERESKEVGCKLEGKTGTETSPFFIVCIECKTVIKTSPSLPRLSIKRLRVNNTLGVF